MTNQTSCGKSNTWPKRPVSGCQPGSVPLRTKILYQLDEIYAKAIDDGIYPSALKAVELNIKMLAYMESPASSLRVADLDTATIERMIIEMGGDPSLDREPGFQSQSQPSASSKPLEPSTSQQELVTHTPASTIRAVDLDVEPMKRVIVELGGELPSQFQTQHQPQIAPRPLENSAAKEEMTSQRHPQSPLHKIQEETIALAKELNSVDKIQQDRFLNHHDQWARNESTQPRSQSGEELRHKPG